MKHLLLVLVVMNGLVLLPAQHNHSKELGLKGKVKKLTCLYYAEGVYLNNTWVAKDTTRFTYKTITYYNPLQNIDSVQTYVNHGGKERLVTRKAYTYTKNNQVTGWQYDYMEEIHYQISMEWLDKNTYIELANDATGKNKIESKIYLDQKFHVIKREDQLYREGELFDHSITETKFNPDNTEHAVSITENKVSNLEYSLDEYIDQRDKTGNPIKKTYKNGISSYRSIKYYIIEYYD
jgi:hypothetical protein